MAYDQFISHAIQGQGFVILPVMPNHVGVICSLPFHHRDPFDGLLVAQTLSERISLVSGDTLLDAYGIQRLW